MPANTVPIFVRIPDIQWVAPAVAANTAKDGTGTTALMFTADATNGSFVHKVRVRHLGTNVASEVSARPWK